LVKADLTGVGSSLKSSASPHIKRVKMCSLKHSIDMFKSRIISQTFVIPSLEPSLSMSGLKRSQKKAGTYSMRAALLLAYILCPTNALISLIIRNIFLILDI
jgi:hypothetical protein